MLRSLIVVTQPIPIALRCASFCLSVLMASAATAQAQPMPVPSHARSGADIYRAGCITCHGADGRGGDQALLGFDNDLPNFTECDFSTPEPDSDWLAIIHEGGTVRGFSQRMPAFKDLLSDREIEAVVGYLRGFCEARGWPLGDLNLPRPLFTEKAFPENEFLLTTTVDHGARAAVGDSLLYERRLGSRAQYEISVPINVQKGSGSWTPGLGDVTLAFKRVLHGNRTRGRIVSAGTEVLLPTGSELRGFGRGVTIVEPFVVAGQMLPSDGFVQMHVGAELPTDTAKAGRELFVRAAAGKSVMEGRWGRAWTPMVELLGAHEFGHSEPTAWDIVPQLQVTLSRRQHIMISGGLKFPLNERDERKSEFVSYFLWDWLDGGLFDGWK